MILNKAETEAEAEAEAQAESLKLPLEKSKNIQLFENPKTALETVNSHPIQRFWCFSFPRGSLGADFCLERET
jgi:hypothetical protein